MTKDEALKFFDEVKAQGSSDKDILGILYLMFQNDEIDIKQLEEFTNLLGYEFTEEFAQMSPEDQKTKGLKEAEDETDASEEEIEDAKEYEGEDDKKSEDKEDEEDDDFDFDEEDEEDEESDDDDSEDEKDKKAAKLFGFDK